MRMSLRCALPTAAALIWAVPAAAQNTTIVPGAEQFSLPPSSPQATPTPTPTPTPVPAVTVPPPPVVVTRPTPTASATPRATPTPAPRTVPSASATPTPSATPAVQPIPAVPTAATPLPVPTVSATPEAGALDTPAVAEPPAAATSGPPSWLWWLLGLTIVAGLAVFAVRRFASRDRSAEDEIVEVVEPVPAPVPPPAPVRAPPATATTAPAVERAIGIDFRPQRLWTRGPDAHLAFEVIFTNTGATALSGVRPTVTLASAGPDTAAEVAAFGARVPSLPANDPFDLRPGQTRTLTGELTLPGSAMYVTTVSDREMIVPVAMVGVAWRGGLSVASAAEAFVIGTGDTTSPRLGPIWVDRAGQQYPRLDARRFRARG